MPEIIGDESVGQKYAINGLLSLTPDGMPILGETPEVKGLWSVAAVWIKEGPGTGKSVAEWMVLGESEIDLHSSDIARFHDHHKTSEHIRARTSEGFNKTYGIVHPMEQWASNRNVRLSPYYEREKALDAVFFETVGWERPFWYESNGALVEKFGEAVMPRTSEWEARWWSPIINAEHLQMRETAGLVDLTAFCIFDVVGAGSLDTVQRTAMRQMDVAVGKVVYTPVLTPNGGFRSDLTIMRLAHDHFRVVTGGAHGMADLKWFRDQLPADGTAQVVDQTSAFTTLGIWGPNARAILESITKDDVSSAGLPVRHLPRHRGRPAARARVAHLLRRRPRLGALRADGAGRQAVGHRRGRPGRRTASSRSASASTAPRDAWRSPTAPMATSSRASTTSSRRACRPTRSRTPTSSGRPRTSGIASRRRPPSCAP